MSESKLDSSIKTLGKEINKLEKNLKEHDERKEKEIIDLTDYAKEIIEKQKGVINNLTEENKILTAASTEELRKIKRIRKFVLKFVKWCAIYEVEKDWEYTVLQLLRSMYETLPWPNNIDTTYPGGSISDWITKYRRDILKVLKGKWKEITNQEYPDKGFADYAYSYFSEDLKKEIEEILKEFEKRGIGGLLNNLEDQWDAREKITYTSEPIQPYVPDTGRGGGGFVGGGGESKISGRGGRRLGRGPFKPKPDLKSPLTEDRTPQDPDDPGGVEYAGEQPNNLEQKFAEAFDGGDGIDLSGGGGDDLSGGGRRRRERLFENMSKEVLKEKLKVFDRAERGNNKPPLGASESAMRQALKDMKKAGKVDINGNPTFQVRLRF